MKRLFFDKAFIRGQWQHDVRLTIQHGVILSLDVGVAVEGAEHVRGLAIPAMANAHSHAFQRGFAGLAEYRPSGKSDFWAWRQAMYAFASKMTPERLEAIAAGLYLECLLAGYSHVGEFHYLHNAHRGEALEMTQALFRAADKVGIGLTLLPVHYQIAGFDGSELSGEQRGFSLSCEEMTGVRQFVAGQLGDKHRLGHCFHSLRAVDADYMQEVMQGVKAGDPVHIHIAEQEEEVAQCLAATGKRPVEWLLENMAVDESWCLVHATHMSHGEVSALAFSGAVAALCPTTEANLGDGIFPLADYLERGGRFAIGSDSQVCRNPCEELQLLEYSQRLHKERRTIACDDDSPHVGTTLWTRAAKGGYGALGVEAGQIAVGARADIIVLDPEHPCLFATPQEQIFDSLIFAGSHGAVKHVMVCGEWQIRAGRHEKQHKIMQHYKSVLREMMA